MVEWPNLAVPPKIGGTLFEVICVAGASGTLSHLLSSRSAPGGRGVPYLPKLSLFLLLASFPFRFVLFRDLLPSL